MDTEPSLEVKETLFIKELRKSTVSKEEILHYERAAPGSEDKSYEFLRNAVRRYLERKQRDANRQNIAKALGNTHGVHPAMPAGGQSGNKNKGKGKGKGKRQR